MSIATVAFYFTAQSNPVVAQKPGAEPLELGSAQGMGSALGRKTEERSRKDPEQTDGNHTMSSSHHECPGGIPHIVGIGCNSTTEQSLTTEDCLVSDGRYVDLWSFSGFSGQIVTVQLSSAAFDTFLYLLDPNSAGASFDNDSGGGTNSTIVFTLYETGTWFAAATSFSANSLGPYSLTLTCGAPPTPTPTRTPTISPTPTSTPTQTASPVPTSTPMALDPTCLRPGSIGCPSSNVTAQLTTADCPLDDGSYYDVFRFSGTEGQIVTILMSSDVFDTLLFLQNPAGEFVANDDDSGGGTNSRLVSTLPSTGAWTVLANSFSAGEFGPYTLSLNCAGGVGPTATPLGAPPPIDIPTLSFPALLLLMVLLTASAFAYLRRG